MSAPRFRDVALPIDFSPMGIDFTIQPGMKGPIDSILAYKGWDIDFDMAQIPDADNNLSVVIPAGSTELVFVENTTCIIDGATYRVVSHSGNGTFGATCVVAREEGGNELRFALKEQDASYKPGDIVKEAMANYFLNLVDDPAKPFFPKIHKIFTSNRTNGNKQGEKIYILMDFLAVDGHKFLKGLNSRSQADTGAVILFDQLAEPLKELYEKYEYNHGDLKPANVMFGHDNRLRLIDFGFTRIRIGGVIIQQDAFNKESNASQDLTQMAALIRHSFTKRMLGRAGKFIEDINTGYGCKLSDAIDGISVDCTCPVTKAPVKISDMGDLYKFCDTCENPMGTFDAVIPEIKRFGTIPTFDLPRLGFSFSRLVKPVAPSGGGGGGLPPIPPLAPGLPPRPPPAALRIVAAAGGGGGGGGGSLTPAVGLPPPPPARTISDIITDLLTGQLFGGAKLRRNKKTRRNSNKNVPKRRNRKSRRL
jgi:serine/threonine protein kinase